MGLKSFIIKIVIKRTFIYKNSLTIFFLLLFFATLWAQAHYGWLEYNEGLIRQSQIILTFPQYLSSGHFMSATFENFESEFLQMGMYVIITVYLRQIGSAESKKIFHKSEVDREPKDHKNAPWPVKKGGFILKLYSNSLFLCFAVLFIISWWLHFQGSWRDNNAELILQKLPTITKAEFLHQPRFWFETFQNWQSEFLSVAAIVFLSIYLRQKGSPESKPVDAPHMETGK